MINVRGARPKYEDHHPNTAGHLDTLSPPTSGVLGKGPRAVVAAAAAGKTGCAQLGGSPLWPEEGEKTVAANRSIHPQAIEPDAHLGGPGGLDRRKWRLSSRARNDTDTGRRGPLIAEGQARVVVAAAAAAAFVVVVLAVAVVADANGGRNSKCTAAAAG